MPPLVSAIIPCYNYGRFVGRAIDSVLAQTYSPLECLVVDDGSTDDTPTVLARYGDRIRVVRQVNGGLSAARNTGITHAQGDYLAFLDADDWWNPEKIARQVELLQTRPELALVGCGLENVSPRLERTRIYRSPSPGPSLEQNLRDVALRKVWVGGSGSGALIRREVFDAVGLFDTTLRASEDRDMWMRIASRYLFDNAPDILVTLQDHDGRSMSGSITVVEENQRRLYDKAITHWPDVFDSRLRREWRALIASDAGRNHLGCGDLGGALRRYIDSLREWPWSRRQWSVTLRLFMKWCWQSGRNVLRPDRTPS